ncbi:MAG: rRNA pseudouridine synthase [Clostridia bacterium]|jgi:16S rRNA pseudouridine516 synthase|nr:rRNA pseudouridine synthase [Clostridia bacterium]
MRIDKYLSSLGLATRREIKELAKKGYISVNSVVVKDASIHIDENSDEVFLKGEKVEYKEHIFVMLNKPQGYITATKDSYNKETVMDLLDKKYSKLFPIGRLDKNTEGLLIFTNNGKFSHEVLSPKKHVKKTYYAHIEGIVTEEDVLAFKDGQEIDGGYKCMPADLKIIKSNEISEIEITIMEGKYHQIKRMFFARGKKVIYLQRISMGNLNLDDKLALGEYRELTSEEVKKIKE